MKMKFRDKLIFHVKRRLPAILVCVLLFCTFGFYYFGLFDVSFIKRPEAWADNGRIFYSLFEKEDDNPPAEENGDATPQTPSSPENESGNKRPSQSGENSPTTTPQNTINITTVMPLKSTLAAEGYYSTDAPFVQGNKFAVFETTYALPKKFSFSFKTTNKEIGVYPDDGTAPYTETATIMEQRPAIELYMGYIIFDDGGTLYIIGPDGTALTQYNEEKYLPAYTRDKEGRPLFYQEYEYKLDYPTETGEPDENGNTPWINYATMKVKDKKYFYLADNGRTFVESDYNDDADNRGLYFDYPAYYGVPDKNDTKEELSRYYKQTTRVVTQTIKKKQVTSIVEDLKWLFKAKKDKEFDPDAEETLYPYTKAYNYSEGYAVVCGDLKWPYTEVEDKALEIDTTAEDYTPTEITQNELYIIDEEGQMMFTSRKNFVSSLKWIENEIYLEPLVRDISSLGSYYFDHGLIRIRRQTYDRYQYTEYDMYMVGTDEDILVDEKGKEFYIPAGYTLEAYSDGMLLLSKDGKYGYMNYLGKWIVQPDLRNAAPFIEGVAAMQKKNGKYGMIDTEGNTVIPFRYSYISNVSSGLVAAYSDSEGWVIYTKMSQ